MKKFFLALGFLAILTFGFFLLTARADEIEDIQKQIDDLRHQREMSEQATAPLQAQLDQLDAEIKKIQGQIDAHSQTVKNKDHELSVLNGEISQHEKELSFQMDLFAKTVRALYVRGQSDLPLTIVLSANDATQLTRELAYRNAVATQDRDIIVSTTNQLKDLVEKKKKASDLKAYLEKEQKRLAQVQSQIDKEAEFYRQEIGEAKKFQSNLSQQIATLTARQQELLAAKTGTFSTSVGEVPPADDPASRPDYNPGFSPAFAAFSFGAPHRVGMSQYGAFGRAKSGQSAETIVKAYYSNVEINKNYPVPATINVDGYGAIPFEDLYLKGIGEMPAKWANEGGFEALKAQAIAARTYALAATNNGQGSICATEACQVYIGYNKGGDWERAVNETRGWVIVQGGTPVNAWYASTAGGFTLSSQEAFGRSTSFATGIVDTTCGGVSCWTSQAYEKIASSPWFYKAWYKTRSGFSCGRSHPWLTQGEFADIVNSLIVYTNDRGALGHLSQTDAGNCWNNPIPETWSADQVRSQAGSFGGPVSSISGVSVSYTNNGKTANVTVQTDKGSFNFSGADFKLIFNLRTPASIYLQSSLFNIEKK